MDVGTWVDEWIRVNVRTRVLDGRPSKQFRDQLVTDISTLLRESQSAQTGDSNGAGKRQVRGRNVSAE